MASQESLIQALCEHFDLVEPTRQFLGSDASVFKPYL